MGLGKPSAPKAITQQDNGSVRTRRALPTAGSVMAGMTVVTSPLRKCVVSLVPITSPLEREGSFCPEDMFRCDERKCLPESRICDREADCTDGTDEPKTCGKNCSLLNRGCDRLCVDTNWGIQHSCAPGCQLQPDFQSCGDVDECSMAHNPCGQLCKNTPGSYSCDCAPGHQLHNGTDCRVTDGTLKILVASNQGLGVLEKRTDIYEIFIPTKSRPTSVAYDLERGMYFWVDSILNVFVLRKPNSVPFYPELKVVNSISLDWFMGQLYWASSFTRVICAGVSVGRGYVKVLEKDLIPEQLMLPEKKYMFWVKRGERGVRTIESAGIDVSDRKVLAVVTIEEPVGLTLDHMTGRFYWISN
ncbi:low-density lipoprotein receptor-related protein 8-like [Sorex fumeus]|uniref:low-density lipoprotein receptor-related protein 8-like n=1 Tax=Sorex fumeus TaxID=62283 RepID=UPI0024AE04FD|nr:low-density lipoprotein receptor-related protein 8-like [Sorex fumeus]